MIVANLVGLTQGGRLLTVPLSYDVVSAQFSTGELNEKMVFSDLYINGERCFSTALTPIEQYLFNNDISINLLNDTDFRQMGEVFAFGLGTCSRLQCCTIASRLLGAASVGESYQPWHDLDGVVNVNDKWNEDDYNVDDGGSVWSIGGVTSNSEPSFTRIDYPDGTYNVYEWPLTSSAYPSLAGWRYVGKWDGQTVKLTSYHSSLGWYGQRINGSADAYVREFFWTLDGATPASRSLSLQFQYGNPQ